MIAELRRFGAMRWGAFAMALAALAFSCGVLAQGGYPDHAVKVIVPWPAGGLADVVARIIGQRLGERLGQAIVIENRTGANGIVGASAAANSPADGYTLFLVTSEVVSINPAVYSKLPYDVSKDFAPITPVVQYFYTLTARTGLPATSTKDLVALARSKPGELTYGSWGTGSVGHLGMEMLAQEQGLQMLHVPYTGGPAAYNALVAGQVDLVMMPSGIADPYRQAKRLNALAVPTEQRLALMNSVPTMREQGYDLVVINHVGFLAPAKTPEPIIKRLNSELAAVMQLPDVQSQLRAQAAEPFVSSPEEYARWIRSEQRRWAEVARKANVKLDN